MSDKKEKKAPTGTGLLGQTGNRPGGSLKSYVVPVENPKKDKKK